MKLSLPSIFSLIFFSLSYVSASIIKKPHAVLEQREYAGPWVKDTKVPANTILPVRIALAQSNLDKGEEHLMRV